MEVIGAFGMDRTLYVLANTVRHKDWDGRISHDNKAWARTIPVYEDTDAWGNDRNTSFVVDQSHPGLTDIFSEPGAERTASSHTALPGGGDQDRSGAAAFRASKAPGTQQPQWNAFHGADLTGLSGKE